MSDNLESKTNEEVTTVKEEPVGETASVSQGEIATNKDDNTKSTEINDTKTETEALEGEAKKKSKKPLIFVISGIAAIAVIVGVILIIVMNSKSEEAKRVDSLISSIGTVTLDSKDKIDNADKEVKALGKEDYDQLDNVGVLEEAKETYEKLVNQSDADVIISLIDAIDENVTLDSKTKIEAARTAYDNAIKSVQKLVTNFEKLTSAETKLEEALNASYTAQAEKVISLINKIGKVNENSESKIKEATEAYDKLPKEAKDLVTNYSALTNAKTEFSAIKKQAVKDKMNNALSKLNKKYDDVRGITFYESPSSPQYADTRSFVLPYIGMRSDDDAWLCLSADYTGKDWIFYSELIINADGSRFSKTCSSSDINRDNDGGVVWEYYNSGATDSDIEWLKAVANANNATIRFSGKYSYDLNVSESDKQAIKDVLDAYEAVTEYALFDISEAIYS